MFFDQLQKLCKNRHESISSVTAKLGFSSAMPTKWRCGATPNGEVIKRFSQYFNASCDYLLGLTDDPTIYYNRNVVSSDTSAILKYLSLDADDKKHAEAFMSFLLSSSKYSDKKSGS